MTTNNILELGLKIIPPDEQLKIDGIIFSGIAYIVVSIDGISLNNSKHFIDSFIVFEELLKSTYETGGYLLFTSVSGIADAGGWSYVKVEHNAEKIKWAIEIDGRVFNYYFERNEYLRQVNRLENEIKQLGDDTNLEPQFVIYPEL